MVFHLKQGHCTGWKLVPCWFSIVKIDTVLAFGLLACSWRILPRCAIILWGRLQPVSDCPCWWQFIGKKYHPAKFQIDRQQPLGNNKQQPNLGLSHPAQQFAYTALAQFNSAYLQNQFRICRKIFSYILGLDATISCWSQVTMMFQ